MFVTANIRYVTAFIRLSSSGWGTCVQDGGFGDVARPVYDGGCQRTACQFDTPTLRGIFASAPYFHDGSAATLDDAVAHFNGFFGLALSPSDQADLVAYLKTL